MLKNNKQKLTYLFIFTFGNVGSKATKFWLPALQGNKQHTEMVSIQMLCGFNTTA